MRLLITALLAVVVLAVVTPAAVGQTLVEKALAEMQAQDTGSSRFSFVVMGDTRHWTPIVQPATFKRILEEVNLLHPSFEIDCGDLILGYTTDPALLQAEWDEFVATISRAKVPFVPVVGNHDVSYPPAYPFYERIVGPRTFSFDYGTSHFVCLSSEEPGAVSNVVGAQVDWLRADLAAHKNAQNIFVFMHQPAFQDHEGDWKAVEALLKEYPTRYVFAGHYHQYYLREQNGIKYVVTGGGGAELSEPDELGNFYEYLFVTVDGNDVHVAVIRPGRVHSEDIALWEDILEAREFPSRVSVSPLFAPAGALGTQRVRVTLLNPTDAPIEGIVRWLLPAEGWEVTPEIDKYEIGPRGKGELEFSVKLVSDACLESPATVFATYPYSSGLHTGSVKVPLLPIVVATVPATPPPKVDGDLSDWASQSVLTMTRAAQVAAASGKWEGPSDLSAQIWLGWDATNLYMALKTSDNSFVEGQAGSEMLSGDRVSFAVSPVAADGKPGPLTYMLAMGIQAGEVLKQQFFPVPSGQSAVLASFEAAIRKTGDGGLIYEAAIPWKNLGVDKVTAGLKIGFNLNLYDVDAGVEGTKTRMAWRPRVGDFRSQTTYGEIELR